MRRARLMLSPIDKLNRRLLLIGLVSSLLGCASTFRAPPLSAEELQIVEAQMSRLYECVWYQYLSDNEARSNELIDEAVDLGRQNGIGAMDVFPVYSRARAQQIAAVDKRAVEIAQQRAAKVENIMGNSVKSTHRSGNHASLAGALQ